jgi:hypothetical protein
MDNPPAHKMWTALRVRRFPTLDTDALTLAKQPFLIIDSGEKGTKFTTYQDCRREEGGSLGMGQPYPVKGKSCASHLDFLPSVGQVSQGVRTHSGRSDIPCSWPWCHPSPGHGSKPSALIWRESALSTMDKNTSRADIRVQVV